MRMSRTTVVTAAIALVLFILTFIIFSHSHLGPGSSSGRSRRALRRGIKTSPVRSLTSAEFRHMDQPVVRQATSSESKTEDQKTPDDKKPSHRSTSSAAARIFRVVSSNTTSDSETLGKKRKFKWTDAVPRNTAQNVSSRLYFQSLNPSRRSNATWMFRRQLKRSERATLMKMFGVVTDALRASNVTFWMDGGTLLGSYRHHNLIPWDDDVDLVLRRSQMRRAFHAIKSLEPAYRMDVEKDAASSAVLMWRVFASNGSVPVTRKRFRFPTVDLHFYTQNATHVWLVPRNLWWYSVWPRSTVFPLHLRPFDRYWVPAPCDTRSYLTSEYRDPHVIGKCASPRVLHRKDLGQRRVSVACRTLPWLPLVTRQRDGYGSVVESLIRGNIAVRQHTIRPKC